MSRKVVRVGVFLLVLSLAAITTRAFSSEPPKKAPPGAEDNPFGAPPDEAKPVAPKPRPDADNDPFGTELKAVKPNKPALPPNAGDDPFGAAPEVGKAPLVVKEPSKPAAPFAAKPKLAPPKKLHGGEKAILKALNQKTTIDFAETPLIDAVEYLSKKHRIPIILDRGGSKDAGVSPDTPVNCKLSGISLQSALEIMLDELQVKWVIHHDVLMITSSSKAESVDLLYTKVYDVADLVRQLDDEFVLQDNPLTAASTTVFNSLSTANMPLSGSFAEGGPHYAENGPRRVGSPTRDFAQQIVASITSGISENSWRDGGGNGTISRLGDRLVVCQSREIHRQIEQLLAQVRHSRRSVPTLRVELYWLWLDAAHRKALCQSGIQTGENDDQEIEARRLSAMVSEVPYFRAQTTCLNAHGTSVAAGDRRALICAAIPVDVMYSPIVTMPNVGVTAELRPTLLRGTESAELYVRSTITRWTAARPPAMVGATWPESKYVNADAQPSTNPKSSHVSIASHGGGSTSCPIDLPVMPTQEFGTTLRVPLGKPVVVGSVTFAPAGDAGVGEAKADPVEVYLIATTSVVKKASKKP